MNKDLIEEEAIVEDSNGESVKLVMTFTKADGKDVDFSYNYANPDARAADVKTLMEGIIANGAIFENVPAIIKSAKFVTTITTNVDLS